MRACTCRRSSLFLSVSLGLVSLWVPGAANAGPGSGPLINFGQSILNFLTGPLAYVVFGVGICIAAISMVMGSREGIRKPSTRSSAAACSSASMRSSTSSSRQVDEAD